MQKTETLLIAFVALIITGATITNAQENNLYTQKIGLIKIAEYTNKTEAQENFELVKYQVKLIESYCDLVGILMESDDIDQDKKDQIYNWNPAVKICNGKKTKAILIFPMGTMTIDDQFSVNLSLSKKFNSWSGNQGLWDLIGLKDFRYNIYDDFNNKKIN